MSLISVYLLWSEVLEWWQIKLHRWEFLVQKKFKLVEFLGGDSHAKEKGYRSYLNKQFWYLLSVKPQKVPFWVLSPKDMTGDDDYVLCKNWYLFKPRPQSRILVRLLYFDLHENENETVCRTHFHVKGFTLRLVLKQRQKIIRKWPIVRDFVAHLVGSTHLRLKPIQTLQMFSFFRGLSSILTSRQQLWN